MVTSHTKIIQVTNVAPQATKDQMQSLFSFLGKIDDIRLYPAARDITTPAMSRICFVRFQDSNSATIAQHLANTVFIDRALIVITVQKTEIPEESEAMDILRKEGLLPYSQNSTELKPQTNDGLQNKGDHPELQENNLPPYPKLLASYDLQKVNIIRRTILIHDYSPEIISPSELLEYFNSAAEIKYMRLCHRTNDKNSIHMLIEFSDQAGVIAALKLNNCELKGQRILLTHSTQAIVAPITKSNELAQLEIEEAMKRLKEAQNMIANAIDPVATIMGKDKDKSVSRSRSRSRDKSVNRKKSRSRSRLRRSRSRSRSRKYRSRSRSRRSRRRRSRSRTRSRSKSKRYRRRSKSRSRSRSRDKHKRLSHRRRRSDSIDRKSISRHKRSPKSRSRTRSRSRDRRHKRRSSQRSRTRSRSKSRTKRRNQIESTTPKISPSNKAEDTKMTSSTYESKVAVNDELNDLNAVYNDLDNINCNVEVGHDVKQEVPIDKYLID